MKKESDQTKGIDITQAGKIIYVSDDIPLQTVIYAVEDVLGNKIYFTQEAAQYIEYARGTRRTQKYVLNYLQKIPAILKDPSIVIIDPEDGSGRTVIYYKEIYIREKQKQDLFALVVKIDKERVVYNFHPQESGKVKFWQDQPKVLYLKTGYKRATYL